jgi:MFS family permease
VDIFGWRSVVLSSAAVTILAGFGTWMFVRDYPREKGFRDFATAPKTAQMPKSDIINDIFHVFAYRNTLLLFIIPGGMVGCVLTFSGLWSVPYLTTMHGISPAGAASLSSALLVAWAIGGPFFGWLSDRIGNRKKVYIMSCAVAVAGWATIIFLPDLTVPQLVPVLLITGFSSGSMIISFAFAKESIPPHLAGTVSGVINMGVMMGPMILQPAVGWMLDRLWTGDLAAGIRIYDYTAYRNGFSLMLAWISLSLLLLLFTRETGCKQMGAEE